MHGTTEANEVSEQKFAALVADDHEFVRNWLCDELQRLYSPRLLSLDSADTPQKAIELALRSKPNLILLDIDFENDRTSNGLDVAERLWKELPQAAIIIISNHKAELYIKHLYRITPPDGAYGYILKDKVAQHLVNAANTVLSGDCWIDPEIHRIAKRISHNTHQVTDNEYEALVCIALGFSDTTAGRLLCLTEKAIQARLRSLYSKFGLAPKGHPDAGVYNPRCRAVWSGFQRGLITESELASWSAEFATKAKGYGVNLDSHGQEEK